MSCAGLATACDTNLTRPFRRCLGLTAVLGCLILGCMRGSRLDPGEIGTITTVAVLEGGWRATCRVRGFDDRDRTINRKAKTKRAAEDSAKQGAQMLRDRLKAIHESEELARKDAERGLVARKIDPTTVRELAVEWRSGLTTNQHLHAATIRSWERLLSAMFGEHTKLRDQRGELVARRRGPREAFDLIADRPPRLVTARDLKDVLALISTTNGSSTARQARTVFSYVFGLAEDKNLVLANPVPLLRGNKGSPVIGRNRVVQTGLNHRRSPSVEVVDALRAALRADPAAGPMSSEGGRREKSQHPKACGMCSICLAYVCERFKPCGRCLDCCSNTGTCSSLRRCYRCTACRAYVEAAGGSKRTLCETPVRPETAENGADIADLADFLFLIGCRLGEALGVLWSNLTLRGDDGEVRIEATVTYAVDHGVWRQPHTKTGDAGLAESGARSVYLIPEALEMLRQRARYFGVDFRPSKLPHSPIFGSPQEPARLRDPRNTTRMIKTLYSKHGVTWGRSHLGRKYLVNRLDAEGVPHVEIAKLMGWRDLNTIKSYLDAETGVSEATKSAMRLALSTDRTSGTAV